MGRNSHDYLRITNSQRFRWHSFDEPPAGYDSGEWQFSSCTLLWWHWVYNCTTSPSSSAVGFDPALREQTGKTEDMLLMTMDAAHAAQLSQL